jgi:TolB-like protein/tetratricopeptide (TPR) repeat protein
MKHCPECNRNYADPTISFCLADGAPLMFGPAVEGAETAVLSGDPPSEAATRIFQPAPTSPRTDEHIGTNRRSIVAGVVGIVLVTVLGVGSYLYYGRGSSKQIDSIAVMPFVNQSGDADLEYLSDGMSESLMNSLKQISGLNVKARSSVFRYKGKDMDAGTIGKELGVQAVLNGRVVQRGDALTLFLELVDTATGDRVWGERYDRKPTEIVSLQSEIARDVSEKLKITLSGDEEKRISKSDTTNPEAYRLYLQGRYYWNKRNSGEHGKAIGLFQQAIDLDPEYAKAYAGLADAVAQSNVLPPLERKEKARAAAEKALSLDNNMAEAHTALAHILLRLEMDLAGAERELDISNKLDPKWADTYQRYAQLYLALGKFDDSIAKARAGLEIEPFNVPLNTTYGIVLSSARRYDEAIDQLNKTIVLDPTNRNAHVALTTVYVLEGEYAEAVEHRIMVSKLAGDDQFAESIRQAFAKAGWPGVLRAELNSPDGYSHYIKAYLLAGLGKRDEAFAELESSLENHEDLSLLFVKTDPRFDPLRDDPRFQEICRRVGLP